MRCEEPLWEDPMVSSAVNVLGRREDTPTAKKKRKRKTPVPKKRTPARKKTLTKRKKITISLEDVEKKVTYSTFQGKKMVNLTMLTKEELDVYLLDLVKKFGTKLDADKK